MRVFVAGHNGMVGSSILRQAPSNYTVLTANKSQLDLTDEYNVQIYLEKMHPDAIILAAAKVGGIGANSANQKSFLYENLKIQNGVMSAASKIGIKKFIFLGSSCIYPRYAEQPIKETSLLSGPLEPTNEGYALAKIAGIRLARAIYEEDKLEYFSLMPTNLYGPNDNFDLVDSHVPASLMRKFHTAKMQDLQEVEIWGTGTPMREFLHVDDLAHACWYFLDRKVGGEIINIGTGEDISIMSFAELMASVVGYDGKIKLNPAKPDGVPKKLLDVSKARNLGWEYRIKLEDGLRQTYNWFTYALKVGKVRGY